MFEKAMAGEAISLFDFNFKPNQYQLVKIVNSTAKGDVAGLYFDGIFNANKHHYEEDDPRIISLIDLNVMKVYFSNKEPTKDWGYPTQLDDLYHDRVVPLSEYGSTFYVTIANPSTYDYGLKMTYEKVTVKESAQNEHSHG